MTNQQDRRHFARVAFSGGVELLQNNRRWQCELVDISLKGALINLPDNCTLNAREPFELTLQLDKDTTIDMTVGWSHGDGRQIGVVCQQIDVLSVGHLRRLIELNTGDPVAAERELHKLGQAG